MRTPTDAWRVLAAALTLVVVGCSGGNTASATPSPAGPTPPPTPAQATDTQGKYRLVFELPASDWRASDAITGRATLSVVGSAGVDFGSSGQGPLVFQFDEVGGSRHMGWSVSADCVTYRLDPGTPISSQIKKSGGADTADPNYDFYHSFFAEAPVHLPPGTWTITAVASLVDGAGCSGAGYTLKAAVVVHVTADTAAQTMVAGPVNGQLFTAPNGGHVACPNNLPCGPDPVGTR